MFTYTKSVKKNKLISSEAEKFLCILKSLVQFLRENDHFRIGFVSFPSI